MDKSGLTFVMLLCVLAAIVLGVLLFHTRQPEVSTVDESLVPPHRQEQPQ